MAISKLTIPARTAASSTGYAGDMNLAIAKINELATSMAISPLTIAAAVGAGNPAADMNTVVAKINELIGGGTTPTTGTKATAPTFGTIDDTNNVVGVSSPYSYTEVVVGMEGGTGSQLASNSIFSPGNVAGRAFAYVVANSAANRLQSDTVYSAPFTLATASNNAPTATITIAGGATTTTPGQSVTLQMAGADADAGDSAVKLEALDNGVKIGEVPGPSGSLQTAGLSAGTHSFTARATDSKGATGLSTAKVVTVTAPAAGYDGRPIQGIPFGDSRTANEGFDGATGETGGWRTKLETLANQGDGAGHHNIRKDSGYPSRDTVFALSAVSAGGFFSSRRDASTYYRQIVPNWFAVNDKYQNPDRTVAFVLDNLRQIYQAEAAMGFLPVAVTEPPNKVQAQYPQWFADLNAGIRANYLGWGCVDIVELDLEASISNMKDTAISPDELHYTTYGNTLLAPIFLKVYNRVAASLGAPTSATNSGGGATKPSAPTIALSGRTFTATAGNALPSSTLRYTLNGGAVQTGNSYTVPDNSTLAANALSFYSVATGNYLQSDAATNTQTVAALPASSFYNSSFDQGFAGTPSDGMFRSNDYGETNAMVTNNPTKRAVIANGALNFNGLQYEGVRQQIKNPDGTPAPAGTYEVTVITSSKTGGGRWSLQNMVNNQGAALNESITAVGTFKKTFTTTIAGEIINLKTEDDGVIGVIDFFDVKPV